MGLHVLAILCTLSLLIYTGFMLRNSWYLGNLPTNPLPLSDRALPFVSIIVPARNEEASIEACLQALVDQAYPPDKFEILLVDDQSTDATADIVRCLAIEHPQIRVAQTDPHIDHAHKKAAITLGVSMARGEFILQTDADCVVSTCWVEAMVRHFRPRTGLLAGPVFLRGQKGRIFDQLQSLEGLGLAGIGAGSLLAGRPNMINGANMGFRKSAFEAVNGFEGIDQVASGDDELLMQKIHLHPDWDISYCGDPKAIVETDVHRNWRAFRNQRLRWVSKARQYLDRRINLIQTVAYVAYLSVPLWGAACLWTQNLQYAVLALQSFILLWLANTLVAYRAGVFFHTLHLLRYSLLLQLLHLPYVLWIGLRGNFVRTYQWKGRTVS